MSRLSPRRRDKTPNRLVISESLKGDGLRVERVRVGACLCLCKYATYMKLLGMANIGQATEPTNDMQKCFMTSSAGSSSCTNAFMSTENSRICGTECCWRVPTSTASEFCSHIAPTLSSSPCLVLRVEAPFKSSDQASRTSLLSGAFGINGKNAQYGHHAPTTCKLISGGVRLCTP